MSNTWKRRINMNKSKEERKKRRYQKIYTPELFVKHFIRKTIFSTSTKRNITDMSPHYWSAHKIKAYKFHHGEINYLLHNRGLRVSSIRTYGEYHVDINLL